MLLADPTAPWERPSLTTHGRGNHAVRSQDWRYIRYADGSEELYDRRVDPNEWKNLASDPSYEGLKKGLGQWIPKSEAPNVPISKKKSPKKSKKK